MNVRNELSNLKNNVYRHLYDLVLHDDDTVDAIGTIQLDIDLYGLQDIGRDNDLDAIFMLCIAKGKLRPVLVTGGGVLQFDAMRSYINKLAEANDVQFSTYVKTLVQAFVASHNDAPLDGNVALFIKSENESMRSFRSGCTTCALSSVCTHNTESARDFNLEDWNVKDSVKH